MNRAAAWSDAWLAVTLAALLTLQVTNRLTMVDTSVRFVSDYPAALLTIAMVAGVLVLLATVVRASHRAWLHRLALLGWALLLATTAHVMLRVVFPEGRAPRWIQLGGGLALRVAVLGVGTCAAGVLAWRWPASMQVALDRLTRALAPLALVVFVRLGLAAMALPQLADPAAAGAVAGQPQRRVVVLLFDMLQTDYVLERRPEDLALPNLDRLLAESWSATQIRPTGWHTLAAIPSLLTGRLVEEGTLTHGGDVLVRFADSDRLALLSSVDTLFTVAAAQGHRPLIVGIPTIYQRLARGGVRFRGTMSPAEARPLGETLAHLWCTQIIPSWPMTLPLGARKLLWSPRESTRWVAALEQSRRQTAASLAGGDYGLLWAHLVPPHFPMVYDRRRGCYDINIPASDLRLDRYLSMVALADAFLGCFVQSLQQSGLWDSTTVVVTSDHWGRHGPPDAQKRRDHRIPLIVHLPGQSAPWRYDQARCQLVLHDLLLALLGGNLTSPAALSQWFDAQPALAEAPASQRGR